MDRRFLRPGWIAGHVLVFLAFLTCLRLGWWQWDRSNDSDGTAQNLGYALLWPAFAVAFIYMWVRFLHLELVKDVEDDEATDRDIRALLDEQDRLEQDRLGHDRRDQAVAEQHRASSREDAANGGDAAIAGAPVSSWNGSGDAAQQADGDADPGQSGTGAADDNPTAGRRRRGELQRPSQSVIVSVAMVGEDDDDDPELTAYNQALAALAEEDRRRAR